jgi:hypothetical protein
LGDAASHAIDATNFANCWRFVILKRTYPGASFTNLMQSERQQRTVDVLLPGLLLHAPTALHGEFQELGNLALGRLAVGCPSRKAAVKVVGPWRERMLSAGHRLSDFKPEDDAILQEP